MPKRSKPINLVQLFFLAVVLASLALALVSAYSLHQALSSKVEEKAYEKVYSEDIILVFSSLKPSYTLGETATFYIDILNTREFPISRVDFSLNVKAISLFGLNVLSIEDYSTRTFKPGKFERIIVERKLPALISPGFFTLELLARPSTLKAPPKASVTVYVKPSTSATTAHLVTLLFSSAICTLLTLGASVDIDKIPKKPALGRLALFAYSINVKSEQVDETLRKTFINFSIGQKFVFLGVCALVVASFPLILGLESFANDLAISAYFSLTVGVINLIWEMMKRETVNSKLHPLGRLILSLTILGVLTYFSNHLLNRILAAAILAFTLYMAIRVRLRT